MLKKLALPVLIIAIVIHIIVPVVMISQGRRTNADLEKYGEEFKLRFTCYDIYNGEMYIAIDNLNTYSHDDEYCTPYVEDDGSICFIYTDEKPETKIYFYMTESNLKKFRRYDVGSDINVYNFGQYEKYVIVRIYDGNIEVVDVLVDGIPIDEWVKNPTEPTTEPTEEDDVILFGDEEILFG